MSVYPNREHQNADQAAKRRAIAALDAIETEMSILRRRIEHGRADDDDTQRMTDAVREVTKNVAILHALRDVREWHAADMADREDQS